MKQCFLKNPSKPEALPPSVLAVKETVAPSVALHDEKVMPCEGEYEYWPVPWKLLPLQLFVTCLHLLFSPWPNDQLQRQTCWGTQYSGWTPPLWRQYFEACVSVRNQLMSSSYNILAAASIGPLEVMCVSRSVGMASHSCQQSDLSLRTTHCKETMPQRVSKSV